MRIAVISKEYSTSNVIFSSIVRALNCYWEAKHFLPSQEPEGWDSYFFVENGDWDYYHCPDHCHPSVFWAMDMTVPRWQYGPNLEKCVERARTFDRVFTSTRNASTYFIKNGIPARWLPFCADEELHQPLDCEKEYDVTAVWHNCGPRIPYSDAVLKHFRAWVGYSEGAGYGEWMSKGCCTLNLTRAQEPNMRILEAMMMCVPLVTDRPRDMEVLFEDGLHYHGFDSINSMIAQVRWILKNRTLAQAIAKRAREEVLAKHTYKHRVREIYGNYRWLEHR